MSWPGTAPLLEQGRILPHGSVMAINLLPGWLQMLPAGGPVKVGFFIPCSLPGLDPVFSSWPNPSSVLRTSGTENQEHERKGNLLLRRGC